MGDSVGFGGNGETGKATAQRTLVPMRIGEATVFVEQVGEDVRVETNDTIYPVSPPSPQEAFEKAGQILQECVRVVGDKVDELAEKAKPRDIAVEFTLSFEAAGKAHLIPVLFTGETKAATGLKVTAVWGPHP